MKIKHQLSSDEVKELADACYKDFPVTFERYIGGEKLREALENHAYVLDLVRFKWQTDAHPERPPSKPVTELLGIAFGMLLHRQLGMKWCEVKDGFFGKELALVWLPESPNDTREMVVVYPFSMVKKRETTKDIEFFVRAIDQLKAHLEAQ